MSITECRQTQRASRQLFSAWSFERVDNTLALAASPTQLRWWNSQDFSHRRAVGGISKPKVIAVAFLSQQPPTLLYWIRSMPIALSPIYSRGRDPTPIDPRESSIHDRCPSA